MSRTVVRRELGRMPYREAWDLQSSLLEEMLRRRDEERQEMAGYLLFVEHPHVYTLGKSGDRRNLLIPEDKLREEKIEFYHTDRGGDITYHGPGQIVGYPILDLNLLGLGIRRYIDLIEETVIRTVAHYGLEAARLEGAAGVWMRAGTSRPEKICAIGVRVSRGITMHGFAFNISTDLHYFRYINPCGFTDKGVTSLEKELGRKIAPEEVKEVLTGHFSRLFDVRTKGEE